LGLAIVGDLVEVYRGQVVLGQSALGGLKVTVVLPWQN
jgi:signal transduction histidine kinase